MKMNDEVARYLKERAEVARSVKQNTTEMDLSNEVFSTTRNALNKENNFFQRLEDILELVEFFNSRLLGQVQAHS